MGKKARRRSGSVSVERTGWTETVIICRKCAKKLSGGFGPDGTQPLRRALRETLKLSGRRGEVGVLEVGCLGVCPKDAVTVVLASAPGQFLIVGRGAPAALVLDHPQAGDAS